MENLSNRLLSYRWGVLYLGRWCIILGAHILKRRWSMSHYHSYSEKILELQWSPLGKPLSIKRHQGWLPTSASSSPVSWKAGLGPPCPLVSSSPSAWTADPLCSSLASAAPLSIGSCLCFFPISSQEPPFFLCCPRLREHKVVMPMGCAA